MQGLTARYEAAGEAVEAARQALDDLVCPDDPDGDGDVPDNGDAGNGDTPGNGDVPDNGEGDTGEAEAQP